MKHRAFGLPLLLLGVMVGTFLAGARAPAQEEMPLKDTDVAATSGEPEKIVLKVWSLPDPRNTTPSTKADLAVIEAFQKKYPYIELRQFSGLTIEGMSMDSGPLMAIAGGVSPDILYVNFRQSDTYIRNNFLLPLDKFIERDMSEEELELRVAKPVWPVIRRKGPPIEGETKETREKHIWCMPYGTLVRVLSYRKDLFIKVGLDPNEPPKDWDEMLEVCRLLTNPQEGTYGIWLASGQQSAWDWITYLWSAGGRAVVQNDDGEWRAVFDSKAAVDSIEYYLMLNALRWTDSEGNRQKGFAYRDMQSRLGGQLWADGKIGIRMNYMGGQDLSRGGTLDPALYGVAPVPYSWNGERGAEINCTMMGIFSEAGISNDGTLGDRDADAVQDAAWKYVHFYDSEEARRIRTEVYVNQGYGKMMNPLYLKRYGYTEFEKFVPPGLLETFEEALESGYPEPYGKNCQEVYKYMTKPLESLIAQAREEVQKPGSDEYNQYGALGDSREELRAKIKKELETAVKDTNEYMIGYLEPDVRAFRHTFSLFVAILIVVVFSFVVYKVWKIFTPEDDPQRQGWLIKKYVFAYILLIPALGLILVWKYIPLVMGSIMAFQDYQIVGESDFVGFANLAEVLWDKTWWLGLMRTIYYMALMLTVGFVPPIILAILLQEVSHARIIYRTIYYLPAVITGVIVVFLWKLMFDPGDQGALNQILNLVGVSNLEWLQDADLAMICVVLPQVWAMMGPACLIYLAALKGIPDDSYEAADIDGANFFQKVLHIVVPNLKALIIIQFINSFIAASQQTGFILVMTGGGPGDATRVAGLQIFEKAYLSLKFGIATTMAWMLGVMLMGFTVVQLRRLARMEFRAAGAAEN
jgi:ABC-type sugar transport system permease subunit/ABC-type glycerol-3-phosphate transport system substrate-binding protein